MVYDPRIHHRRSIRLRGYDYAGGGAYYITICTQDKRCLFGEIVEGEMILNEAGLLVKETWFALPRRFPSLVLDSFQVMPNHLHGILVLPGPGLDPALAKVTGAPIVHPFADAAKGTASRPPTGCDVIVTTNRRGRACPTLGTASRPPTCSCGKPGRASPTPT